MLINRFAQFGRGVYLLLLSQIITAQLITDLGVYDWTVTDSSLNISVPGKFPSYAHLDLEAANVVGQLEYGLNDFNLRWIWMQNWTYSAALSGLSNLTTETWLLFNGLDTFTSIDLCGQHIASTNNQFRQYYFEVSNTLSGCQTNPTLSINFGSAPQIAQDIADEPNQETWPYGVEIPFEIPNRQFIRKEQNDFGWDWGPAYAPAGPWQSGSVVQLTKGQLYPRNTLIDVYKQGQRNNMIPDQSQPWVVNASIDVLGTVPVGSSLSYTLLDASNKTIQSGQMSDVNVTNSIVTGAITFSNGGVDLWWPVGMGPQSLYYISLTITNSNQTLTTVNRRIGFRTIVLNELPVSEEQIAQGIAPGNNWHFEINGYPFYAKGSNFIPPDVFWPRVNASTIRTLFNSVIAGNQNMLRVWSSGAYSPDFMYDIADELGIMLWSEFEFGDALYPANQEFLDNAYEEAVYQVRRVNHHPSLTYWAGGNELENLEIPTAEENASPERFQELLAEYEKLFLTTLFPAVFENSRSISYAPSSTSNGFISLNLTDAPYFQERYQNTSGGIYGETDYYNYNSAVAFNTSAYPVGRFSNEFGYHSMPSLQTWQQYIPNDQLEFNSTYVIYRNRHYPPGGLNTTNYVNTSKGMGEMTVAAQRWYPTPNKIDSVANFSAWCWTTQVFQAEYYGSQIQFYRRGSGLPQRTLGSLYWRKRSLICAMLS